jgi:hypothetical protein
MVEKAREELRKMDEEEYVFPCTVPGCQRRFKAQDDLHVHLEDSKGKAHQKALVMFEKDFVLPCLANGCQKRFMEEDELYMHLMHEGITRADEAHARLFALAYEPSLNDRPGSSHEEDETEEATPYLPHEIDPSQKLITDYFS